MNDRGFLETKINSNGILILKYKGTIATRIANVVSIVTLIGIASYVTVWYILKKSKKQKYC